MTMKVNGLKLTICVAVMLAFDIVFQALVGAAIGHAGRVYKMWGETMSPTVKGGDIVYVRPATSLKRQNIVVCRWPNTAHTSLSRIIGLPGERVEIKHKRIYINGRQIPDPFAHFGGVSAAIDPREARDNFGPIRVPAGHYFLLADNRDDARDSRHRGPIARDLIDGVVIAVNR